MTEYSSSEIQLQFQQLKTFSERLGTALALAADDLRATGLCPAAELLAELQAYRQQFQRLKESVADLPGHSALGNSAHDAVSLEQLGRDLTHKIEVSRAFELLEQITISHQEGDDHPVLIGLRSRITAAIDEVRGSSTQSVATTQAIITGHHPLSALWTLLNQSDTLSDDQWTELLERVADQLGRDVAVAVARHKLFVSHTTTSAESERLVAQVC